MTAKTTDQHSVDEHGIDAFIDSIDISKMRDGSRLREIAAASRDAKKADERLHEAVQAAREAGDSWTAIGLVLGTSKQNAHRKFGH